MEQNGRTYLLDARQVADQVGVHRETVKRWARNGLLPGVKNLSGRWLFNQDDIDELPVAMHDGSGG